MYHRALTQPTTGACFWLTSKRSVFVKMTSGRGNMRFGHMSEPQSDLDEESVVHSDQ